MEIRSVALGAGPAEKREKDESPMNCGHSNWSRTSWDVDAFETWTVLPWRLEATTKKASNTRVISMIERGSFF